MNNIIKTYRFAAALTMFASVATTSHPQTDINIARQAYAKISCAYFANLSNDERHEERRIGLYLSGIMDLQEFYSALERVEFTEDEYLSVPHAMILNTIARPYTSIDFLVGQATVAIERDAEEKFSPITQQNFSFEKMQSESRALYVDANCALLNVSHDIRPLYMRTPVQ